MTAPVDREVILDLLPLYRAGIASPPTRRLVEAWLAEQGSASPENTEPADAHADKGMAALLRARALLRWQRRLYGVAIGLTVLSCTTEATFQRGRLLQAHPLALDYPWVFAPIALAAIASWVGYFRLKARLRP